MAMTILDQIVQYRRSDVAAQKAERPLGRPDCQNLPPTRGFLNRLLQARPQPALIAEVKKASPSKGLLKPDFDPVATARRYAAFPAAAISVLTEARHFQGNLAHLTAIRQAVDLPLLRKDFIVDAYQLYEARLAGADAVLLMASILDDPSLKALHQEAESLGLDCLVEVHTQQEAERMLALDVPLLGVNSRDLHDFTVDLARAERLAAWIKRQPQCPRVLVAESGIHQATDVKRMHQAGYGAILVGESFMVAPDPAAHFHSLYP